MRKPLLIVALFFVSKSCFGQIVFAPAGAEWRYNFVQYFGYYLFNEAISYQKDTVLGSDTVKILTHSRFFLKDNSDYYTFKTFVKQVGDTVYMKNSRTLNNWQILYNFNCQVGQGWSNAINSSPTKVVNHHFRVDSTGFVIINGKSLKRLFVTFSNDLKGWGADEKLIITERLGSQYFLFNYLCQREWSDDDMFVDFLCYQDNDFGLKQFTAKPCDNYDAVGISDVLPENGISIFPNPANDLVTIHKPSAGDAKITFINALGELIYSQQICGTENQIKVSLLRPGFYFVIIEEERTRITSRLIKN